MTASVQRLVLRRWLSKAKACPSCGNPRITITEFTGDIRLECHHAIVRVQVVSRGVDDRFDQIYAKRKAAVEYLVEEWNEKIPKEQPK